MYLSTAHLSGLQQPTTKDTAMNKLLFTSLASVSITLASASAAICDFESPDDPFCLDLGMEWTNEGGQPTITGQLNHTPGGSQSLYNNFNAPIGYNGPPIQTLWIASWAGFPASTVTFSGIITVDLTPGVWQQVDLGGATNFTMTPTFGSTQNFGTFAIDDINFVPAPPTAIALLGLTAFTRRRR